MAVGSDEFKSFQSLFILPQLRETDGQVEVAGEFLLVNGRHHLEVIAGFDDQAELEAKDSMVESAWQVGWLHRQPFVERLHGLRKLVLKTLFGGLEEIGLRILPRHDKSSLFLRHHSELDSHWVEEIFIFAYLIMPIQAHSWIIWVLLSKNLHSI